MCKCLVFRIHGQFRKILLPIFSTRDQMFWLCYLLTFACHLSSSTADNLDIYNTKLATSDLQWDKYSRYPDEGWEEVSSFDDGNYRSTIRSYQVCANGNSRNSDNWIRSPFIAARGGNQIYLEVEYSISRCSSEDGTKKSTCKETFNIFYYEADSHVASSTFPPWQEHPYKKVDTVAANAVGQINTKTFNFGPISRKGFYIAVQDQGACMSLISLRAYYYYCHETTKNLVEYPRTMSEPGVASLATAAGKCTANAITSEDNEPRYRCSSDGKWQIPTGECLCKAGYQPNKLFTDCFECPNGTFKLKAGNFGCLPCPRNSGLSSSSNLGMAAFNQCPCHPGFARAYNEEISLPCSEPPSQPIDLLVAHSNASSALLQWKAPTEDGGRSDVFYLFTCQTALVSSAVTTWDRCLSTVEYLTPSRDGKYAKTFVRVAHLIPFRKYRITIHARNGAFATLDRQSNRTSSSSVEFQTEQAAPSLVKNVKMIRISSTSINVSWDKPDQSNGANMTYEVELWFTDDDIVGVANSNRPIPKSLIEQTSERHKTFTNLASNTEYKARVRAKTSAGFGMYSSSVAIQTHSSADQSSEDQSLSLTVILGIAFFGVLLIAFGIAITFRYRKTGKLLCLRTTKRRKRQNEQDRAQNEFSLQERLIVKLPPPGHRIYVDYPDPLAAITQLGFEISPKSIKTGQFIGSGEFADVCRGKMTLPNNTTIDVAVKQLKKGASAKDQMNFLREASTMAQFNHPNIISLKGVIIKNEPVMIVTEFMKNKSLDGYLKLNRSQLTIIQLVNMLEGIACGMRYLSDFKYVHRDLAARNILVDENLNCKVSDFGLSRTLDNNPHATYTTQGGKIAIRWTALESILYRKFTSASDAWSYGIVMWEVTSYGEKPYWDMSNDDVIENLQSGMRLPAPVGCPKVLHEMMINCWQVEPQTRPSFNDIAENLKSLLRQPSLLLPDVACEAAALPNCDSIQTLNTRQSISQAIDSGMVVTVENWLEIQNMEKYATHFKRRGVDNLEKVSNLTINDLKSMGIDVSLHITKLESGIRTLRRHFSSAAALSSPSINPSKLPNRSQKEGRDMPVAPSRSVLV